jgi:hypothetical protein
VLQNRTLRTTMNEPRRHHPLPRRTPTGGPLCALCKLSLAYLDARISPKMATWQTSRPTLPMLYITILSHRTGAMRNFGECGFYDVGRIEAATKSALRVARIHGDGSGGGGEGGNPVPLLEGGRRAHAGRGGGECSEDDGS